MDTSAAAGKPNENENSRKYTEAERWNKELQMDNLTETNAKLFTFSGLRIDDVRCSRFQWIKTSSSKRKKETTENKEKQKFAHRALEYLLGCGTYSELLRYRLCRASTKIQSVEWIKYFFSCRFYSDFNLEN